jgi:hypothetical protein
MQYITNNYNNHFLRHRDSSPRNSFILNHQVVYNFQGSLQSPGTLAEFNKINTFEDRYFAHLLFIQHHKFTFRYHSPPSPTYHA